MGNHQVKNLNGQKSNSEHPEHDTEGCWVLCEGCFLEKQKDFQKARETEALRAKEDLDTEALRAKGDLDTEALRAKEDRETKERRSKEDQERRALRGEEEGEEDGNDNVVHEPERMLRKRMKDNKFMAKQAKKEQEANRDPETIEEEKNDRAEARECRRSYILYKGNRKLHPDYIEWLNGGQRDDEEPAYAYQDEDPDINS